MRRSFPLLAAIAALAISALAFTAADAAVKKLGKISQAELKAVCEAWGGQYLPAPGTGSYHCVLSDGTQIECDATTNECVSYAQGNTGGGNMGGVEPSVEMEPKTPRPPRRGILGTTPDFSTQKPSATGTPGAPPPPPAKSETIY